MHRTEPSHDVQISRQKREGGVALLVAVMMLVLMGFLGISAMDSVMRDRQIAGYTSRARSALYAADAGVAAALDLIQSTTVSSALAPGDCLSATLTSGSLKNGNTYQADTTASTNQICVISSSEPCSELDASIEIGAGSVYLYTLWDIRVQGQTPDGAISRVQATAQRCSAFN